MTSRNRITRRAAIRTLGGFGLSAVAGSAVASLRDSLPAEGGLPMNQTKQAKHIDINQILPGFSDASRHRLGELTAAPDFAAHISAADAKQLAANESKSVADLMLALLPLARSLARPPISNFFVGAVARGVSGNLYLGANLEIAGLALGYTVHAEQSAIANTYMYGDEGVAAIAVTAAPCGHCRQFMNELSPTRDIDILVLNTAPTTLSKLLPSSFGPKDLGGSGAFPIQKTNLTLKDAKPDSTATAALDAARTSYAPYSKSPSGVAITTRSGRTFKGSYFENAAFNPSLPPLETALLALIAGGEDYAGIAKVTLVELEGGTISQRSVTEAVLAAVAPSVKLQIAKANKA